MSQGVRAVLRRVLAVGLSGVAVTAGSALVTLPVSAQSWLGIGTSNYAGTNAVYLNPSAVADSRYRLYVNVAGGNANLYNNYLTLQAPYSFWQLVRNKVPAAYRNAQGDLIFKPNEYLRETLNGRTKYATFSLEGRLPTVQFSVGEWGQHTFVVGSRVRGFVQANNVSEDVARLSRYGLYEAADLGLAFKALADNRFSANVNAYQEIAASYARPLTQNGRHFWKAGLTVKYLVGLGGGYVNNQGLQYTVYGGDSIQLRSRELSYGFTDYEYYKKSNGFRVGNLYNANRLGRGLGLDLGVTYELRPDYERYNYSMDGATRADETANKYKLRVGLALTDLGRVRYRNDTYVSASRVASTATVQVGSLDTLGYYGLMAIDRQVNEQVGGTTRVGAFKSQLPRALNLNVDWHVRGHFYTGLVWQQNLLSRYAVGARTFSQLALTPRYERRRVEVALPLVLANDYRTLQLGAMLRVGDVFIGSDNLAGALGGVTLRGYDVYAGVGFSLKRRQPKDRDGDHVSDRRDACLTVPGVWEFNGCPDRDHDHVADADDQCPDDPGLKEFQGCPDRDGDKVIDKADDCPDIPGSVALQGCPDRDGDGLRDQDDACPDQAGPRELLGCPDRDKDGVADKEDKCPDVPGSKAHAGCPDTDGDGLYDDTDACPQQAGPVENGGCPWPDADGDTVPDKDDKCPQTPGPVENQGCPVLEKAAQKVLSQAYANLKFEFRKAVIRRKSYPTLNNLAKLLAEKPAYRLRLAGHTDPIGTETFNQRLSLDRARAVRTYLVKRGVAPERFVVEGYGASQPLTSNRTAAGRARNRRVEMTVLFE